MQQQITLTFGAPIFVGKKTERITITCCSDLKKELEEFCLKVGCTVSEFGYQLIVDGLMKEKGRRYMMEALRDKKVSDGMVHG